MTRTTLYPSLVNPPQPQVNDFNQGIFQPWPDIIRPKIAKGLAIALIASGAIGTVLNPNTQIIPKTTYPAWSEPVRQKAGLKAYLQDTGAPDVPLPQPASTVVLQWIYPWSEPVRVKRFSTALQDVGAPDVPLPPPVLSAQWYAPWSEPTRRKGPIAALQKDLFITAVVSADVVVPTAWSNPPPQRRIVFYQSKAAPVFTPTVITADKWLYPWSEPVRRKGLTTALQDVGAPDIPRPPNVLSAQWYAPWTDPVRRKRSTITEAAAFVFTPAGEVVTADKWLYPWSEPTRVKKRPALGDTAALVFTPTTTPVSTAVVIPTTWSEPPPVRKRVLYQSKAYPVTFAVTPVSTDVVVPTAWSGPPPQIKTVQYQAKTDPLTVTAAPFFVPAPVTGDVVFPGYLIYQDIAFVPVVTPAAVVNTSWAVDWSTPVRPAIKVSTATFGFMAVDNALTNFWYQPWPDFARGKRFLTAQQQTLAWSNFTPAPAPAFTDFRWGYPWSEPVRFKKFGPQLQDTGAPDVPLPPPVLSSQWYEPWVDPVRTKKYTTQQTLAWGNFTPTAPVTADMWGYPWSEPVRQKVGLKTHLQSFTSLVTPPQPNFIRTINWYQPWSYPVWKKKGLRTDQQLTFTFGTPVIKTQVTVTMAAIETNLDQLQFSIIVGNIAPIPPAVAGANVSIEEIPAIDSAAASIEET